jgi:hypothetical protein
MVNYVTSALSSSFLNELQFSLAEQVADECGNPVSEKELLQLENNCFFLILCS